MIYEADVRHVVKALEDSLGSVLIGPCHFQLMSTRPNWCSFYWPPFGRGHVMVSLGPMRDRSMQLPVPTAQVGYTYLVPP